MKPIQSETRPDGPEQDSLEQDKTRQDKTEQNKTRQLKTRQLKTRKLKTRQLKTRKTKTGQIKTRPNFNMSPTPSHKGPSVLTRTRLAKEDPCFPNDSYPLKERAEAG